MRGKAEDIEPTLSPFLLGRLIMAAYCLSTTRMPVFRLCTDMHRRSYPALGICATFSLYTRNGHFLHHVQVLVL